MTLSHIETQIDAVRAEASTAQEALSRRIGEINRNTMLSAEGKTIEISEANEAAKIRLKALHDKEKSIVKDAITTREKTLDAKIGSTASDLIAFRDAQDRAERIATPDEAERVITRALRTDDRSLAHAVFRRSLESNWAGPVNVFKQQKPELASIATELNQLVRFNEGSFQRTMAYAAW